MPKINLFTKIVALIIIMLVPIMLFYFYSNKTSTDILGEELNKSNTNQLVFFQNQVDTSIDSMALWPDLLIQDPDIASLRDIFAETAVLNLDLTTLIKRIQTKLAIQQNSSKWRSSLHIYSPMLHRDISDNDVIRYDDADLKQRLKPGWQVKPTEDSQTGPFVFSRYAVTPYSSYLDPSGSNLIIEVQFYSSSIKDMLDKFKSDGRRDPFYYMEDIGVIYNRSADKELTNHVIDLLNSGPLQDMESRNLKVGNEKYLVNIVKSETIGWYLIDYIPISEIIRPIQKTNQLFYISMAGLLLLCCTAAYLLYAQVQVPIKRLIIGFQKLKNGDYSIRMKPRGKSEFGFLYTRFNLMVEQIQELFETVYLEKIHVREARLKQLQSQINPHFFYNCFSFISSMAKLEQNEAVVAMSHHLSNYYRYTTRQERELVSLSEEINFVSSYLEIQRMRMARLNYTITVPSEMRQLDIPPLMLQPLVENAVIHGIEAWSDASVIRITGEWNEDEARLIVEDDGRGMSTEDIMILERKMQNQMDEQMGCGLWNVHQRMHLRFRGTAGVSFASSGLGGLKVTITWSTA
ncbi:sensor histidine kinase [Paenibacillus luteus]|uniref:sensor histidine kinase n=1 Tax=Paenibacillus luteus TaxID=2545753 RepID=UPI001143C6B5|nr:histidine kinase [Paenibacillus luteus]